MENQFFPPLASIADETDQLPEDFNPTPAPDEQEDFNEDKLLQVVESLCMSCNELGTTRMLLTSIPYFKEVVIMSFSCPHCGNQNNEIQPAGAVRDHGITYTVKVLHRSDLDRQIVKSSSCTVVIPEWELTMPPSRGQLTTVEGLIRDIANDLSHDQPLRRVQDAASHDKIQAIVDSLREIILDTDDEDEDTTKVKPAKEDKVAHPFTVKLDDPSGNSWIEFLESMADPKWNMKQYVRTKDQNVTLGLAEVPGLEAASVSESEEKEDELVDENEEIFVFPGICSSCGKELDTLMKKVAIPHFKEVLIMSTNCDACGYKDNEVKSGSAISNQGKRITLSVEDKEDLSRDILKSETCGLIIPEIELTLQSGTLGGRFTTLEGILEQIYDELSEKVFMTGDSTESDAAFPKFLSSLKQIKAAERPFTIILDDPLANSYLQNIYAPDPDPNMTIDFYDRTFQQNEELGLNDIKVEDYEQDSDAGQPPKSIPDMDGSEAG